MASTGIRAFVARFITDQSDFKTDALVDELNQAEVAAKDLDDTSLDGLETELKTVEAAAQGLDAVSTSHLQSELDELRYAADRAARDIDTNMDQAADSIDSESGVRGKLKGTGSEIGAEFSENIGEAFRGGSLSDTILETFTSLGPALGVAGIALGAGAAIVNGVIQGQKKHMEDLKTQMLEMADAVRDGLLAVDRETRLARLRAAESDQESAYNQVLAKAKAAGLDPSIVAALMFGTPAQREAAAAEYQAFYKAKSDEIAKAQQAAAATMTGGLGFSQEIEDAAKLKSGLDTINTAIQEQVGNISGANQAARDRLDIERELGLLTEKDADTVERRQRTLDTTSQTTDDLVESTRRLADEQRRYSDASADAADNQSTINTLLRDRQSIGSGNVLTGRQGE